MQYVQVIISDSEFLKLKLLCSLSYTSKAIIVQRIILNFIASEGFSRFYEHTSMIRELANELLYEVKEHETHTNNS